MQLYTSEGRGDKRFSCSVTAQLLAFDGFVMEFPIGLWILFCAVTRSCEKRWTFGCLRTKYLTVSCWCWWPHVGVLSRSLFWTFLWHNQNEPAHSVPTRSHSLTVIFNTANIISSFKELNKNHSVLLVYWTAWRCSARLHSHSLVWHGAKACIQINVVQTGTDLPDLQVNSPISHSWILNKE